MTKLFQSNIVQNITLKTNALHQFILWPSFSIFYTTLIHNWDSVPNLYRVPHWTSGDYYLNSLWPLSHLGVTCFRPEILACKNNNQILQTMDKRFTVPRWVL